MAGENVINWSLTNWITVFLMVVLGLVAIGIAVGIYTKFTGGNAGGASGT